MTASEAGAEAGLRVAGVSSDAAEYAVMRWHYSRVMPTGKLVKFGVWEDGAFIGVVIFGRGASPNLATAWGISNTEVAELVRVALRAHRAPVSEIVAASLKELRRTQPGLRLVVSFADPHRGHHGGIYQAGNWVYTGESNGTWEFFLDGRWRHVRGTWHDPRRKDGSAPKRWMSGKHRYLYPLDRQMRRRVAKSALPYPVAGQVVGPATERPSRAGERRTA